MSRFCRTILFAIASPISIFLALSYPGTQAAVSKSSERLTGYYLLKQLESEIKYAQSIQGEYGPRYSRIIKDYENLFNPKDLGLSADYKTENTALNSSQKRLASILLWLKGEPYDLLETDPATGIATRINYLKEKERIADLKRSAIIQRHKLECLKFGFPAPAQYMGKKRSIPPKILEQGFLFCGEYIPIHRMDVKKRIEHQIEYLLTDFMEDTSKWLIRKDRYKEIVSKVLKNEKSPRELVLIPALESSYTRFAVSHRNAVGWWQFRKITAQEALSPDPGLDWSLVVNYRRDDRKDLKVSTRSAARYLKWLKIQTSYKGKSSWLTACAAYNAGLALVKNRMRIYRTSNYWDMKLPSETEDYVPRWIALFLLDQNREYYGLETVGIPPLKYETIQLTELKKGLPLTVLAAITESPMSLIRGINGGLRKGIPGFPKGNGHKGKGLTIHVPEGATNKVMAALAANGYISSSNAFYLK